MVILDENIDFIWIFIEKFNFFLKFYFVLGIILGGFSHPKSIFRYRKIEILWKNEFFFEPKIDFSIKKSESELELNRNRNEPEPDRTGTDRTETEPNRGNPDFLKIDLQFQKRSPSWTPYFVFTGLPRFGSGSVLVRSVPVRSRSGSFWFRFNSGSDSRFSIEKE